MFQLKVTLSGNQLCGARAGTRPHPVPRETLPPCHASAVSALRMDPWMDSDCPFLCWAESHLKKATASQPHSKFPKDPDSSSVASFVRDPWWTAMRQRPFVTSMKPSRMLHPRRLFCLSCPSRQPEPQIFQPNHLLVSKNRFVRESASA